MVLTIKDVLKARLIRTEGRRNQLYDDATGLPPVLKGKLTGGIGWNFTDKGIPDQVVEILFDIAYGEAVNGANSLPVYNKLNLARKTVLIDMVFNMGVQKVLGFRRMFDRLKVGDFAGAAAEMLDSKWANDVGIRAVELAGIMKDGQIKNAPDLVE